MDVSAYSSQNLISQYQTGIQSQKNDDQGLRLQQKSKTAATPPVTNDDDQSTIAAARGLETNTDMLLRPSDLTKVHSASQADRTAETKAKAAEDAEVRELEVRDQEVRTHEAAHKATGGQYAGAVSLEYESGPDGNRYAVGGEVSIDISSESTPEKTISKMAQVRAAAMAPANPSAQDRSVAAAASAKSVAAMREMQTNKAEESEADNETIGLQDAEKNHQTAQYEKNERVIGAPAPTGRNGDATGFQDTGALKSGAHKQISTFA
jgi:hypothetical protein